MDLTEQWFYQVQNCFAYLIDYHRPFHHSNLIDSYRKIFVVDDGCKSFVECPTEDDVRIFKELNHGQSDSESDGEDDNDNSDEEPASEQEEQNDANEEIK